MKAIKITVIIIVAIAGLVIVAGLILPKKIVVEQDVWVGAPQDVVFLYISDFRHFVKWSPFQDYDPLMKTTFEGTAGRIGAKYTWAGNEQVGKGSQVIERIVPNQLVELKLVFEEPWQSESKVYYKIDSFAGGTHVVWGYEEPAPIPKNILLRLMGVETMLSKDFRRGLGALKVLVEDRSEVVNDGYQ